MDNKAILITGGTGSLGQALVQYILDNYKPKKVVIYSRGERAQVEMKRKFADDRLRFLIGDVRDEARLARAMLGVDYVIHAAALKHVDVAEYNPEESIKTNILGSMNAVEAALASNVERVVAISTDKACNPSNLYGATKLCADKLFLAANVHKPIFSVVQFGNIAGSSGSIIPLWKEQCKTGTITITDPNATRFLIVPEDVASFICDRVELGGVGTFIPRMYSCTLNNLALAIVPGCVQVEIGLQVGEKKHEEIDYGDEIVYSNDSLLTVRDIKRYLGDICE